MNHSISDPAMNELWERIETTEGRPSLKTDGRSVAEVIERLESGESAEAVSAGQPLDLIAVLAFAAVGDDSSTGPALIQRPPVRPGLAAALSEDGVGRLFPSASRADRLALLAGLLQAHDFWSASHDAAQEADDLGERWFSAYWHGVAHRREPDPGNASYWFRRVGKHPLFPTLARVALPELQNHGDERLTARLTGSGGWDPFAMIELCSQARPGTRERTLARRLQRLEMKLLLEATAAAL